MGGNIIPMLVEQRRGAGLRLLAQRGARARRERDRGYWRDVGTLDAYYDAHMDLISVAPGVQPLQPRVADPTPGTSRCRRRSSCSTSDGRTRPRARLDGLRRRRRSRAATVRRSVLSPGVHVHSYAEVEDSVLMHGVEVGRSAVVRRAILDKNVRVARGRADRRRPRGGPRALHGLRRRRRRDRQGRRVVAA